MEEHMSLTHSSIGQYSLTDDKYFMMIQNTCIRYDNTLKQKPSITSRAAYQHELDDDPSVQDEEDDHQDKNFAPDGIDTSFHHTNFKKSPHVKSLIPKTQPGKPKSKRLYLQNLHIMDLSTVGSTQVPFLTCTLEIPQKLFAVQVLALNFLLS